MSAFSNKKGQNALPTHAEKSTLQASSLRFHDKRNIARLGWAFLLLSLSVWVSAKRFGGYLNVLPHTGHHRAEDICPQQEPLSPSGYAELVDELNALYSTDEFKEQAIDLLSGAVQIPTVNTDDMGPVGEDSRWDIFEDFHSYLLLKFPLIHSSLELTKVNTYGLVYRWEGSDPSLKPILMMAHQDVVPVNDDALPNWKYSPFSGHYDGQYIWGRGTCDCKGPLISALTALETLLSKDFKPTRSIFVVSGFDEETSGKQGASYIANLLLQRYGEDYFAAIIDEGFGHQEQYGARFALPGVGEKGYMDVSITVETPGGHSSLPPPHTSIGMLASALVHLENHPYLPSLTRTTPVYSALLCQAEHGPEMPKRLRELLFGSVTDDTDLGLALTLLLDADDTRAIRSSLSTTQAINIVNGGLKVNALPESARAILNHRIDIPSSTQEVADRITGLLRPITEEYNLTFIPFDTADHRRSSSAGAFQLGNPLNNWLEPAPLTPTGAAPWDVLAGTIRQTWNVGLGAAANETTFVAPSLMTANTDTRYFWNLSQHIYRYNHIGAEDVGGYHTTNEFIAARGLVEHIRFFTYFVLNFDEAEV